jgi:CRISPR-associated protein Cmr3
MRGKVPGTGIKVRLETCSVGRFLSFGGFDLAKYEPKPMKKAVPAGSVYYFELEEKSNASQQIKILVEHYATNRNSISEFKTNEGFGRVFIGKQ